MAVRLAVLLALVAGCGASPRPEPVVARAEASGGEARETTESTVLPEVALLEARLAETEAENEALRSALSRAHRAATECDADGAIDVDTDEAPDVEVSEAEAGDDRPVLRLYGPPVEERPAMRTEGVTALAGPDAPPMVVAAPPGSLGRLVVTDDAVPAIPTSPVIVVPRGSAPAPSDPAIAAYQDALRLVAERDLDGALRAFGVFLAAHPDHAYADNALYWRAEVHYTRHAYDAAIDELELLLARFPDGSKVPDALLRLGMCWERLGDSARARQYFERVRREHPDSSAAHMASREDA